jgi:hypothetical protein
MESRERVIDLLALIRTVLKKWRIMLIFGILFALLSAAYFGVYKNRNTSDVVDSEVALEENESPDIYAAELEIIDNSIANKNRYIQNSKLLQLDPNAVSRAYIRFSIEMDDTDESTEGTGEEVAVQEVIDGQQAQDNPVVETVDNASADMAGSGENATDGISQVYLDDSSRKAVLILRHYINAVNYDTDYEKLSSLLGIEKEYIRELVWASVEDEAALSGNIQAVFSDEENAVMIAEQALETLRGDKAAATGLYGRHKVIVEPAVVRTTSDRSYNTQLKERLQEMNDLKTQKDNFQKNFNLTENVVEEITDTEKKISRRELVKYGVIGFILGCLLFLLVYAIILIASGILLSSRELGRMFGMDKLAVIPDSRIKSGLDRLISGIGSDRFSSRDEKIAYEIAAENMCEKLSGISDSCSVAVVTDLGEEAAARAGQILEEFLKDKNISISVLPHLNQSPRELNELKSCDAAVLLLQGGYSRLRHVTEFQNTLRTYKKTVLGSIVIE